jgi:hypothetical protein
MSFPSFGAVLTPPESRAAAKVMRGALVRVRCHVEARLRRGEAPRPCIVSNVDIKGDPQKRVSDRHFQNGSCNEANGMSFIIFFSALNGGGRHFERTVAP